MDLRPFPRNRERRGENDQAHHVRQSLLPGQVPAMAGVDGQSHIPFFFADNIDFSSFSIRGSYEYRISLLDVVGNGYEVVAPFQVIPEPSSWVLVVTSVFALLAAVWSRRKTIIIIGFQNNNQE